MRGMVDGLWHLVAACYEVVDADGEVLCLLKAGAPPPVDHAQSHDLIPAHSPPI